MLKKCICCGDVSQSVHAVMPTLATAYDCVAMGDLLDVVQNVGAIVRKVPVSVSEMYKDVKVNPNLFQLMPV